MKPIIREPLNLVRKRTFSVWRSVVKDAGGGSQAPDEQRSIRKRVKTISKSFLSPWAVKSNVDASDFAVVRAPKRPTFQNLAVFLRNSKVTPGLDVESLSGTDSTDKIVKLLLAITGVGVFFVVVLLLLR